MLILISAVSLSLSSLFLLRVLKLKGRIGYLLAFFVFFAAQVVIIGNILSAMNHLAEIRYWTLFSVLAAALSFLILVGRGSQKQPLNWPGWANFRPMWTAVKSWMATLSRFEKLVLTPLILTLLITGLVNLAVILFSAPHNWDSMTYHLARMAYYLQHNNANHFDADYWAQIYHPKNSAFLLLYTYLITNRSENLTQLVQYSAFWIAVISLYGISRKVGATQTQSLFAAAVGGLLTEWLMEAATTQNDLIVTACIGSTLFFLFSFRESSQRKHLGLAALGIGLALGIKASAFLALLPIALIGLYCIVKPQTTRRANLLNLGCFLLFTVLAAALLALPSGYSENIRDSGNPLGPEEIRQIHSFAGQPIATILKHGTKNQLRYGIEFLSLDGLPAVGPVRAAQTWLRFIPTRVDQILSLNLEGKQWTRVHFNLNKAPAAHEDASYWGILGFGLVWIMVILAALGINQSAAQRVLAFAAILFLLVQSYSGPYDPWRGRYFVTAALFAVPTVGFALQAQKRLWRILLLAVVITGCISALTAVLFREHSRVMTIKGSVYPNTSVFTMDRMEQLTRNQPAYTEPLQKFDQLVPIDAVVAVYLWGDSYEYPLFGRGLTRTIIPINSFDRGLQPIPDNADYLFYQEQKFPCPLAEDIHLGADLYLRRLNSSNRNCNN